MKEKKFIFLLILVQQQESKIWSSNMTACIATEQVSTIITDHIFKVILKSGDAIIT